MVFLLRGEVWIFLIFGGVFLGLGVVIILGEFGDERIWFLVFIFWSCFFGVGLVIMGVLFIILECFIFFVIMENYGLKIM